MQFRDLHKQYEYLKDDMNRAISSVLNSAHFIGGEEVNRLENTLAEYVGVKNCISCGNGTDALQLALMALNVGPGDAVFIPDFTFFSSAETVAAVGATPIFVDISTATFNIDPKSLENAIEFCVHDHLDLNPMAIVAVDLFGQPADYISIRRIAKKYNLKIIEDGAQGFGGHITDIGDKAKRNCSFGDIATTSFFPAKPLGCYGDGGAIFTNNDEWAEVIRSFKVHGKGKDKYDNIRIGMNSRLDAIQAAVLNVKMKYFDEELQKINRAALEYDRLFAESECKDDEVIVPQVPQNFYSSWAQYTVLFKCKSVRDAVQRGLANRNIPCNIYYPKGLSKQQAFRDKMFFVDVTNSESVSTRCLSLPISPYIDNDDLCQVVSSIAQIVEENIN